MARARSRLSSYVFLLALAAAVAAVWWFGRGEDPRAALPTTSPVPSPAPTGSGAPTKSAGPKAEAPGFPPAAAAARKSLAALKVAWGKNWESYQRSEFGPFTPRTDDRCDTRDYVLIRDLDKLRRGDRNPCVILYGVLHDPYTGKEHPYTYRKASQVEIDHLVPLGAAWRAGAYGWSAERRSAFANDIDELLAVDKQANQDKGSQTPDKWKPRKAYWCEYGRRWTGIKAKYHLTVTAPEKLALQDLLASCPR
ncbi:HNH endonuclease family protein [Streptomyces boninensis]|uniref:HNH endonuclease family protein n=1 Tax=Streptomyces boninensis TaxID=2039455 RepID=UPI003B21B1FA